MNLIYYQNNIPAFFRILNKTLHTVLKLASELCTRNDRGHIYKHNLFFKKLIRYSSIYDFLSERLSDSGFTYSRLAD